MVALRLDLASLGTELGAIVAASREFAVLLD